MRFRGRLLVSAAAFGLISLQAADATDLPPRVAAPPPMAPAAFIPPVYNWTGFYFGANLGYGWSDGDGTITIDGVGAGPISFSGDGVLGGIQAGLNWQSGAFVLGVEADIQASGGKADVVGSPGGASLTGEAETPWFGTIRGRLGFANDRWLFYATGGGLYGEATMDGTVSAPGTGAFSSSETFWSWTAGAGAEAALWDRWSAKFEYLFVSAPSDVPAPPGTALVDGDAESHILRTGLNYHF